MRDALSRQLSHALGRSVEITKHAAVSGGCIHQTTRVSTRDGEDFFVKANAPGELPTFEAEAEGLEELRATGAIRVPRPICHGMAAGQSFLVIEFIQMSSRGDDAVCGRQLADLHRHTAERFGWHRDNFLGATPQSNTWSTDWVSFFRDQRLRPQIEQARRNGGRFSSAETILARIESLFRGYNPVPSLLHGDLWGGNSAFDDKGNPVIFDPAVYYGDRETDLALTELFGGFSDAFYRAYHEEWPIDEGYQTRRELYNLYHVLNHFNLFGSGYDRQARSLIKGILTSIG